MTKNADADVKYRLLTEFMGENAIIARGLVEHFLTGENKLKACQMATVEYASQFGVFLPTDKPNKTSPIGRHLRDADVFKQFEKKSTKGYTLEEGGNFIKFVKFLDSNGDYGTRLEGTFDEDLARHQVLEYLKEYGHIRANQASNKIPPKTYKVIAGKAARGDLDVIYVPKGALVVTKHMGEREVVEYYVD